MGEVYRADDLKLGQAVARKFLPQSLERDEARRSLFLDEVRVARPVSHSNVCRVYDVGEVDGRQFISMEYVDGEDLSVLLRRIGHLPKDKAVEIARQVCAGLAAAHEQGVLHRDLKPANIMIDGRGRAKITDLGLASLVTDDEDPSAGTPTYMAPEQLAGGPASIQSELHALGLVLYELFTGKRPFQAATTEEPARQGARRRRLAFPEAIRWPRLWRQERRRPQSWLPKRVRSETVARWWHGPSCPQSSFSRSLSY